MGQQLNQLILIFSHSKNRTQGARINSSYSKKVNTSMVTKNPMIVPGLFNFELIDLFHKCENDIMNGFMDSNAPYSFAENISFAIIKIQKI